MLMTKGSFSECGERLHPSSTRGQGTSDSMIGLELEGDSLSDSQSNFASASQSDEGFPAREDIFAAKLTSRSLTLDGTLGGLNMSGTINAAGSTGDASRSANTAAAGSTNNPWARQQNPREAPLVTPPAARRKEVLRAPTIWAKMITDTYLMFSNFFFEKKAVIFVI